MRPLAETSFGRRVFNLAPTTVRKNNKAPSRRAAAAPPTNHRNDRGDLVSLDQQHHTPTTNERSYAEVVSSYRPAPQIPSYDPRYDSLSSVISMMQKQMAAMMKMMQQNTANKRSVSFVDDRMEEDEEIDQFNDDTEQFVDDASSPLEQRLAAERSQF
jgi:hypothetical protein